MASTLLSMILTFFNLTSGFRLQIKGVSTKVVKLSLTKDRLQRRTGESNRANLLELAGKVSTRGVLEVLQARTQRWSGLIVS